MARLTDKVTVICYGESEEMTRKEARKKFWDCARNSEGAERDRYMNILFDLDDGKMVCTDGVK